MNQDKFEKWFTELEPHTIADYGSPVENFAWWGWQAAQADQAERVKELQAQVNKLNISSVVITDGYTKSFRDSQEKITDQAKTIAQLNSTIKNLREALNSKEIFSLCPYSDEGEAK